MVKRVGFEPTILLTVYTLSKRTPKPEAGYIKKWYSTEERRIMKTIKYAVKLASSYSDVIALK